MSGHTIHARVVAILALALLVRVAYGATNYYVAAAPDGDDSNPGTIDQPFATIAKARDVVRTVNGSMTGDITVYLRHGWHVQTSTLAFSQTDSGSNGFNVIYAAYPSEFPVISGGRTVTGWTIHDAGKNIWKATVPGLNTRQLYINCVRAVRAHKGAGLPDAVKTSTGYTTSDTNMQNWGNPSDVEFVYNAVQGGTEGARWTERRCGVSNIASTTITMKEPGWGLCRLEPSWYTPLRVTNPTDIENAYELLDQPGEWYLDRSAGIVYYIPREGEDLTTANVIAPVLETLVSGAGNLATPIQNIQFRGITFAHATWLRPSTGDGFPEIQANYCSGNGWTPGNIVFSAARSLRFERCVFKHLGAIGLELTGGAQDCVVAGCVFTDVSAGCIKIGSTDDPTRSDARARDSGNQVVNCYIHDAPCEYRGGVGIFAGYVSDLTIEHNELGWLPYSAVSVGWGWGTYSYASNNQINYNDFHHWVRDLSDGGAIYTLSAQTNSAWHHNYGHDMPWGDGDMKRGWYTDEGSAYIDIYSNVIAQIAAAIWYSAWTPSIHDNRIFDNYTDTGSYDNKGTRNVMTNNTLVTDGNWPQAALDIMNGAGIESGWADVKFLTCACSVADPDPLNPPRLVSARAISESEVEVTFSEAVEIASAETTTNYTLVPAAGISAATRSPNPSIVMLTTATLDEQIAYTLTVNGVRDISVPPNTIASNSQAQFVSGDLLGWWKFDETSGVTAADASGNNLDATVTGPTWTSGRMNGALDLGAADALAMSGPTGDMTAFTVAFWIKPRSRSDYNQCIGPSWSQFLFHTSSDGSIYCGIDQGSWSSRFTLPAGTLALDAWQHFAFTYDAGAAEFYKDGQIQATSTGMNAPTLWTGFSAGSFDGLLDDLRIYSRALTSGEVAELTLDTDGDGTPDGSDPDDDNDGMSDVNEATAGTNSKDAGSVLRVTACEFPGAGFEFVIRWQSVAGKFYAVQAATNLMNGFAPVAGASNIPAAYPVDNVYTDSVDGVDNRFYRVRVE